MKTRFLIGLTLAVGLSVSLSLILAGLVPFFSTGLQPVYAQDAGEKKFWVFDGHTHPTWSVYARGGTIAEANSDPRFTLPLAEQGWLERDQLLKMLGVDSNALNVAIYRARGQLGAGGIDGAAGVVEVRRGQRRIGIEPDRMEVVPL